MESSDSYDDETRCIMARRLGWPSPSEYSGSPCGSQSISSASSTDSPVMSSDNDAGVKGGNRQEVVSPCPGLINPGMSPRRVVAPVGPKVGLGTRGCVAILGLVRPSHKYTTDHHGSGG